MKKVLIIVLLPVLTASPAVAAGNAGQYYAGAKISEGLGVFGGYTIDQNFSAEIEYTDLGSTGYYDNRAIGVSGVYTHPIKNQISLVGKLGIANASSDYSNQGTTYTRTNTSLSFAIGAEYAFNPRAFVQGGFQSYSLADGVGTADSLFVAGVYKF